VLDASSSPAPAIARRAWPIFSSLSGYQKEWLRSDLSAGLAIAAVALPISIAYPAIADLPSEAGLYATIGALLAYAIFGPSRQLIVGPDAATLTLLAAVLAAILSNLPAEAAADRVALAATLSVAVGLLCLAARVLGLGVLANFLSRPILTGFFAGIALSIMVGQIGRLTGLYIDSHGLLRPLVEVVRESDQIHWPSLALGLAVIALLLGIKAMPTRVPGPVVAVVLSIILSVLLGFEGMGIAIVGDISAGMPGLTMPQPGAIPVDLLVLGTLAIFLVSFGSGIVTARSFAARSGEEVDANRELTGFGAANIASGLIGGFPVTGADSRTAVNVSTGGRSQIAGLVAAAALLAMFVFLGGALRLLPQPTLGAILVVAALGLINVAEIRQLWRVSRIEFLFAAIAFLGPLSLGVLNGIVIAVSATLVFLIRRGMRPRIAELGRVPGRDGFYKLHRVPEAGPEPGLALVAVQGSFLFFSADYVKARLRDYAANLPPGTRWLVIDAGAAAQMDSTGAAALAALAEDLAARGIALGLAELNSDAQTLLGRAGVIDRIGPSMVFDDLDDALRAFRATGS